jgi:hypothetical protein
MAHPSTLQPHSLKLSTLFSRAITSTGWRQVKNRAFELSHLTPLGSRIPMVVLSKTLEVPRVGKILSNIRGNVGGVVPCVVTRVGGHGSNSLKFLVDRRIVFSTRKYFTILRGEETCLQLCNAVGELNMEFPEDSYMDGHPLYRSSDTLD